jgi:hypothetical protein
MTIKFRRFAWLTFTMAVLGFAPPLSAQNVTFTDLRDAVPLKFFSAGTTQPDAANPNTLIIGFESGRDSGNLLDDEFRASTLAFGNRVAMDALSFNIVAPAGYYVSSITFEQAGAGTIQRVADARGTSSWVVNGLPGSLGVFRTDPSLSQTITFTDSRLTVVPVSITTSLFVFAPPSAGDATLEVTSARVTVAVAPLGTGDEKKNAVINVAGFTGGYDGAAHGATGTATGVNGEDLGALLNLGDTFINAPGGIANWSFAGNDQYNAASGSVAIAITRVDATVSVTGFSGVYDGAPHGATGTATGVLGENLSSLLNLGASFTNVPGGLAAWTFGGDTNYNATSGSAAIEISKATPVLTWPQPAAVASGTVLGAAQLNATANVAGTFAYSPAAGTVLTATQELSVTFTPADATNYNPAQASVTITVLPNTGAQIVNPGPQTDSVGDQVRLRLRVTGGTRDDRRGEFSATGLPPGLEMRDDGDIRGRLTTEGTYLVTVTFTRGGASTSTQFAWTVLPRARR